MYVIPNVILLAEKGTVNGVYSVDIFVTRFY